MSKKINSVRSLVDALGGSTKAGRFFGVSRQQVNTWQSRGWVPPEYCLAMERLTKLGLRVPLSLFKVHVAGRKP